jgi:very-short-patch-repair endonuclease
LNSKQLKRMRFRRQHPVVYFIADFYCHTAKLIIEIDGGIHLLPEQFEYDQRRDEELKKHGLTILRFTNDDVLNSLDDVIQHIEATIEEMQL